MPWRSGGPVEAVCSIEVMVRYTFACPTQVSRIKQGLIAAGLVLGVAAGGCGGSAQARSHPTATGLPSPAVASTAASSSGPVRAVATNSVAIKNFAFSPATITVKPGTRVTWVNHDEDAHTVAFQSSLKVASNPLQGNQSFSYTFQTPGTYTYICSIHPFMHGTVIVANA
jgi:plastocyanin